MLTFHYAIDARREDYKAPPQSTRQQLHWASRTVVCWSGWLEMRMDRSRSGRKPHLDGWIINTASYYGPGEKFKGFPCSHEPNHLQIYNGPLALCISNFAYSRIEPDLHIPKANGQGYMRAEDNGPCRLLTCVADNQDYLEISEYQDSERTRKEMIYKDQGCRPFQRWPVHWARNQKISICWV